MVGPGKEAPGMLGLWIGKGRAEIGLTFCEMAMAADAEEYFPGEVWPLSKLFEYLNWLASGVSGR